MVFSAAGVGAAEPKLKAGLVGADDEEVLAEGLEKAFEPKLKAGAAPPVEGAVLELEPNENVGALPEEDAAAPKVKAGAAGLDSDFSPPASGFFSDPAGELPGDSVEEEKRRGLGLLGAAKEKAGAVGFRELSEELD